MFPPYQYNLYIPHLMTVVTTTIVTIIMMVSTMTLYATVLIDDKDTLGLPNLNIYINMIKLWGFHTTTYTFSEIKVIYINNKHITHHSHHTSSIYR
jgi:hypothetical protein